MHKSVVILASLAALCLAQTAMAQTTVHVTGNRPDSYQSIPGSSALNVWVSAVGSSVPIAPSVSNNVSLQFSLTPGQTYTFHTTQPSFYHYHEDIQVSGSVMNYFAPLIPVASGVTIVTMWNATNHGFFGQSNMTFPSGVFSFTDFPKTYGNGSVHFGTGIPPAQFENQIYAMRFTNLEAGVYRLYSEARNYQTSATFMDGWSRYAIFAGNDEAHGLKTVLNSASRSEINWYAGYMTVTKPSTECFKYEWSTVDTYSFQFGEFDTSLPGAAAISLTQDCYDLSSPASLECVDMIFDNTNETRTCGAFGDPHIITFDSVGVTCSNQTAMTLVDNAYFSLTATASFVSASNIATVFTSFTFTYKLPCNPITVTWTQTNTNPVIPNAPLAYRHRLYNSGRNMYYIDALHMRFQVRKAFPSGITFGLSIPNTLVSASTGVCKESCPGYEQDISAKKDDQSTKNAQLAAAACADTGDYVYRACLFDVTVSGDAGFADTAADFTQMNHELAGVWTVPDAPPEWPEPTPDTLPPPTSAPTSTPTSTPNSTPSSTPSAVPVEVVIPIGNNPTATAPTPTSASVVIIPSIFVVVASLASLLF